MASGMMMMMIMMMIMIAQAVFDLFLGRGIDWAVQDVAQLRQWLVEARTSHEMRAMRPDWSLESIKTKLEQLRRGASDESRPLKRRRTSEVLAEIEAAVRDRGAAAVSERAPSAQLAGYVALNAMAGPFVGRD